MGYMIKQQNQKGEHFNNKAQAKNTAKIQGPKQKLKIVQND
jgi:hypothetical protein